MSRNIKYKIIKDFIFIIILYGCYSCDTVDIKRLYPNDDYPISITKNFKITYTDAAQVRLVMKSKTHEDFSNKKFPYNNFPDGLEIDIFDSKKNETTITCDTAKIYQVSSIIELKGNVVIITYDGKVLKTPKLYWNRKTDWIFTEEVFTFTNPEDKTIMSGLGIDFSKSFQDVVAHKTTGIVYIENKKNLNNFGY